MNSRDRGRNDRVQGEGDYEADLRYRTNARKFVRNSDVEQAARNAAPSSAAEAEALVTAEQLGQERSKGEDETDVMQAAEKAPSGQ